MLNLPGFGVSYVTNDGQIYNLYRNRAGDSRNYPVLWRRQAEMAGPPARRHQGGKGELPVLFSPYHHDPDKHDYNNNNQYNKKNILRFTGMKMGIHL